MSVCLSHDSALEYLRAPAVRDAYFPGEATRPWSASSAQGNLPALQCADADEVAQRLGASSPRPSEPLHVLVTSPGLRRGGRDVRAHVLGRPLPRTWCPQVAEDVYVCGPELCFAQMACSLDLIDAVLLGYELCGTYARTAHGQLATYGLQPLTTPHLLETRLGHMRVGTRAVAGARKALHALRYVCAGSASLRETHQSMLLGLPRMYGGYGLRGALLNHRVDVGASGRRYAGGSYYVCDAYWPGAKLDVEYDSDAFHVGAERTAGDARRRNALLAMGVSVITVTNEQLRDAGQFDRLARTIARKLGVRLPRDTPEWARRRSELRRRLLG